MNHHTQAAYQYILLVLLVFALALAGYAGYELYPRFDLPTATGISVYLLAAAAGIASFFTPCSFPLLTVVLARSIEPDKDRALFRAMRYGAALAAGISLFLLLVGVGIALGAGAVFEQVTFTSIAGRWLRTVLGILLILLGLVQIGRLSIPFGRVTVLTVPIHKLQTRMRDQQPTLAFGTYGFGYILAGFG